MMTAGLKRDIARRTTRIVPAPPAVRKRLPLGVRPAPTAVMPDAQHPPLVRHNATHRGIGLDIALAPKGEPRRHVQKPFGVIHDVR